MAPRSERRPPRTRPAPAPEAPPSGYFDRSRRPLEILALVAPLIVAYEIGLLGALRHGDWIVTNRAHSSLLSLFHWAGVRGEHLLLPAMSLPALAVAVVLVTWQALSRRPWSLHLPTVGGMAIESILTAVPVVLFGWLVAAFIASAPAWLPLASVSAPGAGTGLVEGLPLPGRIALAIGAGIYEEFLFRLVLVSLLHSLLRRLPGFGERGAVVGAVVLAALAFALHHPVVRDGHFLVGETLFLFGAGCWWGTLFVVRGLGIAIGSHAVYDMLVVSLPLLTIRTPG